MTVASSAFDPGLVGFWHETDVAVAGVDVCFVG